MKLKFTEFNSVTECGSGSKRETRAGVTGVRRGSQWLRIISDARREKLGSRPEHHLTVSENCCASLFWPHLTHL